MKAIVLNSVPRCTSALHTLCIIVMLLLSLLVATASARTQVCGGSQKYVVFTGEAEGTVLSDADGAGSDVKYDTSTAGSGRDACSVTITCPAGSTHWAFAIAGRTTEGPDGLQASSDYVWANACGKTVEEGYGICRFITAVFGAFGETHDVVRQYLEERLVLGFRVNNEQGADSFGWALAFKCFSGDGISSSPIPTSSNDGSGGGNGTVIGGPTSLAPTPTNKFSNSNGTLSVVGRGDSNGTVLVVAVVVCALAVAVVGGAVLVFWLCGRSSSNNNKQQEEEEEEGRQGEKEAKLSTASTKFNGFASAAVGVSGREPIAEQLEDEARNHPGVEGRGGGGGGLRGLPLVFRRHSHPPPVVAAASTTSVVVALRSDSSGHVDDETRKGKNRQFWWSVQQQEEEEDDDNELWEGNKQEGNCHYNDPFQQQQNSSHDGGAPHPWWNQKQEDKKTRKDDGGTRAERVVSPPLPTTPPPQRPAAAATSVYVVPLGQHSFPPLRSTATANNDPPSSPFRLVPLGVAPPS